MSASASSTLERIRDARAQQEVADLRGLVLEDLVNQVVGHRVFIAGEGLYQLVDVGRRLKQEGGESESGRPALGLRLQRGDLVAGHGQAGEGEHASRLVDGEREIRAAQLRHATLNAQTRQAKGAGRRGWR